MKKAIKNILMLSIALVSVCIISQTDVSAASIGVDPGTPKRTYYNVYSTPYSDVTYPNLHCTSWFDKAYYLVVKSNGGQGKIDMPIQGLW